LIIQLEKIGERYLYMDYRAPVYRGVPFQAIRLEEYRLGQISYWPGFSSTSKSRSVAKTFSMNRATVEFPTAFIFEIYLAQSHVECMTHIDLPRDWSHYPVEQEVLLLPFFHYMVVGSRLVLDMQDGIKSRVVTLVELPHQYPLG
jgi:hypothetical protein